MGVLANVIRVSAIPRKRNATLDLYQRVAEAGKSLVARTLTSRHEKVFPLGHSCAHSLALLWQEQKGSHADTSKFTALPMCLHDAANGMGIRSEQQMPDFVSHDTGEN